MSKTLAELLYEAMSESGVLGDSQAAGYIYANSIAARLTARGVRVGDDAAARSAAYRAAILATPTPPEIDVERLSRWAEWIVSDNHGPDWACAECRPKSDMLVSGFRCVPHDAAAYRDAPWRESPIDVDRLARALWEDDDHSLGDVNAYRAEAIRLAREYDDLPPSRRRDTVNNTWETE